MKRISSSRTVQKKGLLGCHYYFLVSLPCSFLCYLHKIYARPHEVDHNCYEPLAVDVSSRPIHTFRCRSSSHVIILLLGPLVIVLYLT